MSSKKLTDFLVRVSTNAKLREQCRRDPEGAMTKAGLSEVDKVALRSRDPKKIRQRCGDDLPKGTLVIVWGTVAKVE